MSFEFLPQDWQVTTLKNAGMWLSGGTPSRSEPSLWNGSLPWLGTKDLKSFSLSDAQEHLTELGGRTGTKIVPSGTILFAVRGMSLANEFRVGISTRDVAFNQDIKAIIPRAELEPRFFGWYLRYIGSRILLRVETASHGTKRLPLDRIAGLPVPMPPLAEQRRIAAILDKADAIRRKRQEAIALTEELLRSAFLEMFGDPVTNPKGWPRAKIEDVTTKVTDGAHHTPKREESGIPLLSARNIKQGYIDFNEKVDYVGEVEFARLAKRYMPQMGDLLISCSGSIGRVTVVRQSDPFTMVRSVAAIRPNSAMIHAEFLESLLQTDWMQAAMGKAARSSAQANLFQGPIRNLPVMVPDITIQTEWATKKRMLLRVAASQSKAIDIADNLFHSLVQRAFRGEL